MNKNNAILIAIAAIIATFSTGCATHHARYATTTYVAEPVYGQPAYVETVYAQPTYISTTIIDDPLPPPPRYHGHRHEHRYHRDVRPPAGAHRPTGVRPKPQPSHTRQTAKPAAKPGRMKSVAKPTAQPARVKPAAKPASKPARAKPAAKPSFARPSSGKQGGKGIKYTKGK